MIHFEFSSVITDVIPIMMTLMRMMMMMMMIRIQLDEVMEKETYKKAKEILEKFSRESDDSDESKVVVLKVVLMIMTTTMMMMMMMIIIIIITCMCFYSAFFAQSLCSGVFNNIVVVVVIRMAMFQCLTSRVKGNGCLAHQSLPATLALTLISGMQEFLLMEMMDGWKVEWML